MRARESKRGEREKCLEAKKMKENVNTETFGLFFIFIFYMGRAMLNLSILFLG